MLNNPPFLWSGGIVLGHRAAIQALADYVDAAAQLDMPADVEVVGDAKKALRIGYATDFEHKVVKGRHATGLAKGRSYKRHLREFGSADPKPDKSFVHPALWDFAEKAAK